MEKERDRENNYSVATCEWPMGRILCRLLPQLGERESWVGPKVRVPTPYPPLSSLSLSLSPTKIALQQRSSYFCLIAKSHSDLALATDWRLPLAGIVSIPCVQPSHRPPHPSGEWGESRQDMRGVFGRGGGVEWVSEWRGIPYHLSPPPRRGVPRRAPPERDSLGSHHPRVFVSTLRGGGISGHTWAHTHIPWR